ncbi:MAG: biosynthetic arginine decarboxylase [Planctomycetota bacterium]
MTQAPFQPSETERAERSENAPWSTAAAADLYRVPGWSNGYFGVNERGHIEARPLGKASEAAIDLHDVVRGLDDRGVAAPVVVRFREIVGAQIAELGAAFDAAMDDADYGAGQTERPRYRPIYPIKVNQQRLVCEEIRDLGAERGVGFEAGSKPELLAVLALTEGRGDVPIVCNGFKDAEYVETVVLAQKLGRDILLTIERFAELELAVRLAELHGVRPRLGVRMKPAAKAAGAWESSAGERSKFGLSADELVAATAYLAERDLGSCLELVHFHVGSQVCDIRGFKTAVAELAHTYVELRRLGAGLKTVNVGGGLAVDYDGSGSATLSSKNYSVREYAEDVVWRLKDVCERCNEPAPTIYSESGRAMTAYSSVLVLNVVGCRRFDVDPDLPGIKAQLADNETPPAPIEDLVDAYERGLELQPAKADGLAEAMGVLHDAQQARDEAIKLYQLGYLGLPMRAAAERLWWSIGRRVLASAQRDHEGDLPEDLADIRRQLADIYFCNFSVFQSLPDHWAIRQLFPVAPIHRLGERPDRRATLGDMSCDSDGRVDRFPSPSGSAYESTLPVHTLRPEEPYYLGVFLVGAYQEVLGDLHNLFGDTHVVHVSLREDGGWQIDDLVEGDTVREVLGYVQHDATSIRRALRRDTERALREQRLTTTESRQLLSFCEGGLEGYTYLE